ncbi:unannotated protein [freshwater metagenome]|uniref:Unannotated protein n=1 Tax=freshwater metagenome TaxID=449393 RepID=A0A6J6XK13_9ZZZZ
MTLGADRRHHQDAAIVQPRDQRFFWRLSKAGHAHLMIDEQLHAIADVGRVGAHVHAKGLGGAALHIGNCRAELSKVHCGAGQNAKAASIRGSTGEPRPCHPSHAGLNDGVLDAEEFAQIGLQPWVGHSANLTKLRGGASHEGRDDRSRLVRRQWARGSRPRRRRSQAQSSWQPAHRQPTRQDERSRAALNDWPS